MIKLAWAIALITGLGAAVAVAVPASASQDTLTNQTIRIGSCRDSGLHAQCQANGAVNHPIRIKVHVKATPNQRFDGAWAMICTKGNRQGQTKGTVSGLTPRVKELRMPFTNPDHCDVAAIARLRNRGALHVYLTARVPS
jgi:hypothetical protein